MVQKRAGAERPAGDRLHKVGGTVALTLGVDVCLEPLLERNKLSSRELPRQVAQVFPGLLEELGRIQVPERIGGEIADPATAPVDVLEAALRIVRRRARAACWQGGGWAER